jgi:hypothetical protein
VGESELARESDIRAYELRDHANDREKFFITAMYQRAVTGSLEAAHQTLLLWVETYHATFMSTDCFQVSPRWAPADTRNPLSKGSNPLCSIWISLRLM